MKYNHFSGCRPPMSRAEYVLEILPWYKGRKSDVRQASIATLRRWHKELKQEQTINLMKKPKLWSDRFKPHVPFLEEIKKAEENV